MHICRVALFFDTGGEQAELVTPRALAVRPQDVLRAPATPWKSGAGVRRVRAGGPLNALIHPLRERVKGLSRKLQKGGTPTRPAVRDAHPQPPQKQMLGREPSRQPLQSSLRISQ